MSGASKRCIWDIFLCHKDLVIPRIAIHKADDVLSMGVALFKFLKSMHTRSLPFFLYTGTTLEIHLAYRHRRINFVSINLVISAFISGNTSGLHCLAPCWYGWYPGLIGNRCSIIDRSNPGIS
jgi:hypothetical protein